MGERGGYLCRDVRSGGAPGSTAFWKLVPRAEGAGQDKMLVWLKQQKHLELLEGRDLGGARIG